MTAEAYVSKIVKKVKCSRKKRGEIQRQLLADISMEMEQGTSLEEIMQHMGGSAEIADDFNENLSKEERKKYKTQVAVKVIGILAVVVLAAIFLFYWFLPHPVTVGSSGHFTEEGIKAQSEKVIGWFHAGDYETLLESSNEAVRQALKAEEIDQIKEQFGKDWGAFLEYGKWYIQELEQRGSAVAVVQVNAVYEHTGVTYTLMFDEDMRLSGIYIK